MTTAPPGTQAATGTTIAFTFPLGRYHATAMGTSANDGVVEWPPSPWRLLRALYSAWRTRCADISPGVAEVLLGALAAVPEYHLDPRTAIGNTRHYMPGESSGAETRSLVHDTFVVCSPTRPTLHVSWPSVDLDDAARAALGRICDSLTWLGRAESLVDARLLDPGEPHPPPNSFVAPDGNGLEGAPIRLLVPTTPLDVEALTVDMQTIRSAAKTRATLPPKAVLRTFVRPVPEAIRPRVRSVSPSPRPTAVRLAVVPVEPQEQAPGPPSAATVVDTVEAGRSRARLPIADVVVHAAALRRAAMSRFGALNDGLGSQILSGRDHAGPLLGHGHAHYLPVSGGTPATGATTIDSFLVWAPAGLAEAEVETLRQLRRVAAWQWVSASREFRVVLDGIGTPGELAPEMVTPRGSGRVWASLTPVVPGHHPRHGRSWEEQMRLEIARSLTDRQLPDARVEVERWPGPFCTVRPRAGRPSHRAQSVRFAATLTFEESLHLAGPLCLGAQSHFGLGMFVAVS